MTIDEAIKHAREKAKEQRKDHKECTHREFYGCNGCADYYSKSCNECAEEHEKLAGWLEDYKKLKHETEQDIYERAYKEGQDKGLSDGRFVGYNKAIDNMVTSLIRNSRTEVIDGKIALIVTDERIKLIAEQLKEGGKCLW